MWLRWGRKWPLLRRTRKDDFRAKTQGVGGWGEGAEVSLLHPWTGRRVIILLRLSSYASTLGRSSIVASYRSTDATLSLLLPPFTFFSSSYVVLLFLFFVLLKPIFTVLFLLLPIPLHTSSFPLSSLLHSLFFCSNLRSPPSSPSFATHLQPVHVWCICVCVSLSVWYVYMSFSLLFLLFTSFPIHLIYIPYILLFRLLRFAWVLLVGLIHFLIS